MSVVEGRKFEKKVQNLWSDAKKLVVDNRVFTSLLWQ